MYSAITGWGMAVPEKILTNADLERIVDTTDEWIVSRTGIRERHITTPDETASTLAIRAAREALACAHLAPTDLDMIILGTVTGDYAFPATACLVQDAVGATCPAFDIQAACTGWIYGMVMAHQFVSTGAARHVLVIGVEVLSKIMDMRDRATCVLFGDGAGATIVSASETPGGVLGWTLGTDGARPEQLYRKAGGSKYPITRDNIDSHDPYISMMGSEVFKFATRTMGIAMEEALANAGLTAHDIDLFIPHQANLRIIDAASRRLELPPEKVFVNIERYGNTSAAAIPIALCEAIGQGRIVPGSRVGCVAFGAGLTWGALALQWTAPVEGAGD
jgi:3-oxoacyl-[acyl-carrier-protein] synthase-3